MRSGMTNLNWRNAAARLGIPLGEIAATNPTPTASTVRYKIVKWGLIVAAIGVAGYLAYRFVLKRTSNVAV